MKKTNKNTYPYTYARISAMKSKLLDKDTYHKLLKMEPNGIANFLAESEYQKAIDDLGTQWSGTELIERALGLHLAQIIEKLRKITPGNLHTVLEMYSKRWDYENVKTILRGKRSHTSRQVLSTLLLPAGTWLKTTHDFLLEANTSEEVLDRAGLGSVKKYLNQEAAVLENAIDEVYYNNLLTCAKQSEFFSFYDLLQYEIDMLNLLFLLRQKIQGNESSFVFIKNGHLKEQELQKLTQKSVNEILSYLEKKGWKTNEDEHAEKTVRSIEINLIRSYLYKARRLLHTKPLRADIIFGYLFGKEIEVKNLQIITKGKSLGVRTDILEAVLV